MEVLNYFNNGDHSEYDITNETTVIMCDNKVPNIEVGKSYTKIDINGRIYDLDDVKRVKKNFITIINAKKITEYVHITTKSIMIDEKNFCIFMINKIPTINYALNCDIETVISTYRSSWLCLSFSIMENKKMYIETVGTNNTLEHCSFKNLNEVFKLIVHFGNLFNIINYSLIDAAHIKYQEKDYCLSKLNLLAGKPISIYSKYGFVITNKELQDKIELIKKIPIDTIIKNLIDFKMLYELEKSFTPECRYVIVCKIGEKLSFNPNGHPSSQSFEPWKITKKDLYEIIKHENLDNYKGILSREQNYVLHNIMEKIYYENYSTIEINGTIILQDVINMAYLLNDLRGFEMSSQKITLPSA